MSDSESDIDATETFRLDPNDRPITGAVGKYELYELLGAGSMGAVYRAVDPKLGREVAVKLMTPAVANDPDLRDRFHREAQTAGSLQHPNIITIFEFGEAEDRLYIAMEYVEGRDLSRIIRNHEAMSLLDKLGVALDVLAGLDYAHEHQITHRDIKPGNIRLTQDGRAKIMDFGIAHLADSDLTGTGLVLGTPSYMAPESLKGDPPSPAGDVYSVGAVLYELIAYRKPFEGSTQQEVLYRVLSDDPTPLRDIDPSVPRGVEKIVQKAMAKDPTERYLGAEALADDLKAACVALQGETGSTIIDATRPVLTASGIRWGWTALVATGVIGLSWAASRIVKNPVEETTRVALEGPSLVAGIQPDLSADSVIRGPTQRDTLLFALRDAALARRVEVEAAGTPAADLATGDRRLIDADSLAGEGRYSEAILALSNATTRWNDAETTFLARARAAARPRRTQPSPPQVVVVQQPEPEPQGDPPPPVRDDAADISAVVTELSRALESRNVDRLRVVYPSLTDREATVWRRFFRGAEDLKTDLVLNQLQSMGRSASATVEGSYTYRNTAGVQRQPMSFPATFSKQNGRWQISHLGSTG